MFTERPESNVLRRSVRKSFNTLIVSPSLTPEVEEISFDQGVGYHPEN